MKKEVCPTPVIDVVIAKYPCPGCKTECDRGLPYVDPSLLSDKKQIMQVDTLCFKCHRRHLLAYQAKKDKKVRLIDFKFEGKSVLRRLKKSIQLGGESTKTRKQRQ